MSPLPYHPITMKTNIVIFIALIATAFCNLFAAEAAKGAQWKIETENSAVYKKAIKDFSFLYFESKERGFLYSATSGKKVWMIDLDEKIEQSEFLQNDSILFYHSGKYAWTFDTHTGKQRWQLQLNNYESKGVHHLFGTRYYVSVEESLKCFDLLAGKLLWNITMPKVDQNDFNRIDTVGSIIIFSYNTTQVAVDVEHGKMLWLRKIDCNTDAVKKSLFYSLPLHAFGKILYVLDNDKIIIVDAKNGETVFDGKNIEVNTDLMEKKHQWLYRSIGDSILVFAMNKGAIVINAASNKEIARKEFRIDEEFEIFQPSAAGCFVYGIEKVFHFNFTNGHVAEISLPVKEMRNAQTYSIAEKNIVMLSALNKMIAFDVADGKVLWESKTEDPNFEGFVHRFALNDSAASLMTDSSNILCIYNRKRSGFSSEKGTYLYLLSMNVFTGAVNYKTKIFLSEEVTGADARTTMQPVSVTSTGKSFGYENLGFEYHASYFNNNILFFCKTNKPMRNPETREDGGEGFVCIDPKTGQTVFKNYFDICRDMSNEQWSLLSSLEQLRRNAVWYIVGTRRCIAFDIEKGKPVWTLGSEFMRKSQPFDIVLQDSVLFVKFGVKEFRSVLDEKKKKMVVEKMYDFDPYGFLAIHKDDGRILWRYETEEDPALRMPLYSIHNYYDSTNKQIYFADKTMLYGLKCIADSGKIVWQFDMNKNDIGKLIEDEGYAVTTNRLFVSASDNSSAKFIDEDSSYNRKLRKQLRVLSNGSRLVVFGPDAIASINAKTGAKEWLYEWDFTPKSIQMTPQIIDNRIVYCIDRKLKSLDVATGKIIFENKVPEQVSFFLDLKQTTLYVVFEDGLEAYSLQK